MENKNQTREEVEKLIKSLLKWAGEQPEYTTCIYPNDDRVVNPIDKLQLAGLAEKAKYLLQDAPNQQEAFWNFAKALGQNNITSILITLPKLVDALCELRNTMEGDNSKESYQQEPKGKDDDSALYLFQKDGNMWYVRFNDESGHYNNSVCFNTVVKLLEKPGRWFLATELSGKRRETIATIVVDPNKIEPSIVDMSNIRNFIKDEGKKADKKATNDVFKKYKDLEEELAAAQKNNDEAEIIRIEGELNKTGSYINDSKGKFVNDLGRIRSTISKRIKNLQEVLKDGNNPKLAKHLEYSIKAYSYGFEYNPENSISWKL